MPGDLSRYDLSAAENVPPIAFREDFSQPEPGIYGDRPIVRDDNAGNPSLRLRGPQLFNLPFGYVDDLRLTATVRLRLGALHFSVRQSGAGGYSAVIEADGQVTLLRADIEVAAARLSTAEQLREGTLLRIDARGSRITVRLGGERLIAFDDPQPLPYGVITFGSLDRPRVRAAIDDLTLDATTAPDIASGRDLIESLTRLRDAQQRSDPFPGLDRVYFTRPNSSINEIWSTDPDGSDPRLVVSPGQEAEISEDGRRLAFISHRDGSWRVWVKLAEGIIQQVSPPVPGADYGDRRPTWASDNVRLAYIRNSNTIRTVDLRTGEDTQKYVGPAGMADLDWSPGSDNLLVLMSSLSSSLTEIRPDGSVWVVSETISNLFSIRAMTYTGDGGQVLLAIKRLPLFNNIYEVVRVTMKHPDSTPAVVEAPVVFDGIDPATELPIGIINDLALSPNGDGMIALELDTPAGHQIRYITAAGEIAVLGSISDARPHISWFGNAEFDPTYERCVSVPVPTLDPTQGVSISLLDDYAQTPSITNTPLPSGYRLEFTGKVIDAAQTPWLEVNAVIPDYAGSPTPAAPYAAPYWLSAGAFSAGGVYLDPCEDDAQINDPQEGFTGDSYYLPLLEQPERTLTPTATQTLHPGCYLNVSGTVNVREYPIDGSVIGQIEPSDAPTEVTGKSMQEMGGSTWYRVFRQEGWSAPETQYGWVSGAVVQIQETYECELLNEFDVTVTPIVALPTYTPSLTPFPTYSATPTLGPSATRIPRIVVTEAQPLHAMADQIGLPLPFSVWPRATPEPNSPSWFQNGYGPNQHAFNTCYASVPTGPCQYTGTARIHQGLDYYVPADLLSGPISGTCVDPLDGGAVYAVCDGVIVAGISDGGSARPNSLINGLSLRCFADEPRDPDNDGQPNLSNIIVVYNHLSPSSLPSTMTLVEAGQLLGYTRNYNVESIPTPTPQPCIAAHLDLQVFVAQNFVGDNRSEQIQINPLMLFGQELTNRHFEGDGSLKYPVGYEAFTLQGNTLDWFGLSYWNDASNPAFISDVADYLAEVSYSPPNCILDAGNSTCEQIIPNDMD